MTTTTTSRLSLADTWRREWYLFRFAWHMQDYPHKQYKQVKKDLRTQMTLAAGDVGMRQAVTDLGHPTVLAEQYVAGLGRRLPRWTTGATAAACAVVLLVYLGLAYALGTHNTLEAMGGGSITTYPFGAETTFTHTDDEISLEMTSSAAGLGFFAVVAAVTFLVASRAWRALP